MFENLITILMLLGILLVLNLSNIVFGAVIGSEKEGFSWKKLRKGISKMFLFSLAFIASCFCVEVTPMILSRIGIVIPSDIASLTEIIGITLIAYKKYVKDCYEKIYTILGIKEEKRK